MNWLTRIWHWVRSLFKRGEPPFHVEKLDEDPKSLRPCMLYLVGDGPIPWKAMLLCPCGCGEVIELNLAPPGPPLWRATANSDRTLSLHPSVWRTSGCRSHFWLRSGHIVWCHAGDKVEH